MNSMEESMLLDELFSLRKADKAEREQLLAKLDRMTEQLLALNESSQAQTQMIDELKRMLSDRDTLIEKLRKENAALKEQKKLSDKKRFDGKTQKLSSKNRASDSREVDKEDFDGRSTPGLPSEEAGRTFRHLPGGNRNGLSAAYHTFISTCRANGVSALAYLKKFFREVVKERRDYENLLPMIIGINTNKL